MATFARHPLFACTLTLLVSPASIAANPGDASPVAFEWNTRLRHETVDEAEFQREADATTLRLRAGVRFQLGSDFTALVEGEGIAAAGDRYNSGANGRVAYPVIADPTGVELNQAWLGWREDRGSATVGRQRVLVDNQRWVGNVGWRQNEQTFDAVALDWKASNQLTTRYAWFNRVHRINGDDARDPLSRERELDTHLVDVAYVHGRQQWGGYVIAHDDRDVAAASSITAGLRWTGNHAVDGTGWGWRMELARQRDHAGNPLDFAHDYLLAEPFVIWQGVRLAAGWEQLGGNGTHALQTPLATLHGFNGWADRFLVTPPGGLEDRYLSAGGALGRTPLKWTMAWHDYRADRGDRYGSEWDASLAFPVRGKLTGLVKVADYRSDGFSSDTRKAWLQLEWSH